MIAIFENGSEFANICVAELRSSFWSVRVPPLGYTVTEGDAHNTSSVPTDQRAEFRCFLRDELRDCNCTQKFATSNAFTVHLRIVHGIRGLAPAVTYNNVCRL